ncbi:hypothetical protein TYRP_000056 [Tyrophagus putrescentiae]|nr:hypothetical protein TYRP_000056 [Tyrophagus putrescentiae]
MAAVAGIGGDMGQGPLESTMLAPPLMGLSFGWWPYAFPNPFRPAVHSPPDSMGVDIFSRTSWRASILVVV